MKNIDFSMTYWALKTFGKQLYANMSAAIAELVANGLDAEATEVYVHMDIINKDSATIAIFDNGNGMDDTILENAYAVIGRNKREGLKEEVASKIMGRKGIGKLAALYLSNSYSIITKTEEMDSPRCWTLSIPQKQQDDVIPQLKEVLYPLSDDDVFGEQLLKNEKGTIILLRNVKISNFGEAAEEALEHKLANYFLVENLSQKIYLCVLRDKKDTIEYKPVEKNIALGNMAVIYSTDLDKFSELNGNTIYFKDKALKTKEQIFKTTREILSIPNEIETTIRESGGISKKVTNQSAGVLEIDGKTYSYNLDGWIGIHSSIEQMDAALNCDNFEKNMHYNPNQLRIYVRNKLATSSFLNYLGMTAAFLNYIEGEISFDILDVEGLEDIATAGRDNFSVHDERVKLLIALCKGIVGKLVAKRQKIADAMSKNRDIVEALINEQERNEIKSRFRKGTIKSKNVFEKMTKEEQEAVEDDFVQFSRAANLYRDTKRILISHKADCVEFGNFLIDILLKIAPILKDNIIFTSSSDYGVPQGYDICSYLNECFRDDIYVIFLFSKSYYDSNVCLAEAGAAWGTNRKYTNFVIDMPFGDISDPINRNQKGAKLIFSSEEDKKDFAKELIRIVNSVGIEKNYIVDDIVKIIDDVQLQYTGKLSVPTYRPYRKFQAIPKCSNCNHAMILNEDNSQLKYTCECGAENINVQIK